MRMYLDTRIALEKRDGEVAEEAESGNHYAVEGPRQPPA